MQFVLFTWYRILWERSHVFLVSCSLEKTLRNFSCLTTGDSIMVAYNNKKYYIDIIQTTPSSAISIIETDCEVDFAPPLDYKEPARPPPSIPSSKVPPKGFQLVILPIAFYSWFLCFPYHFGFYVLCCIFLFHALLKAIVCKEYIWCLYLCVCVFFPFHLRTWLFFIW